MTIREPGHRAGEAKLRRSIGFWALTAVIVNITIGGSIFALPGTLAMSMGAMAPLAFIFGGVLFAPIVACFAAAASRVTATGGPYSFVEAAFGSLAGLVIGCLLWISSVAGSGSMSAALADQVALLAPQLSPPLPRALLMLSVYAMLVALNSRGIKAGVTVVTAFALAKLMPLVALATAGFGYIDWAAAMPVATPSWTSLGTSLVLVVFAYSGLETALTPSGEVVNPESVVPKAAFVGIGLVIVLYVALQFVAQGVLGSNLRDANAPLANVADVIAPGSGALLLLTASVSLIGTIQGDLLGSSRLLYALARDGFLPSSLASVSTRHAVPVRAVAVHAFVGWILATGGSFKTLALISGGAFCFVYIGCCAAAWRLQQQKVVSIGRVIMLRGGALIPGVAILGLLAVLATLSAAEWGAIGCVAAIAALSYAFRRH